MTEKVKRALQWRVGFEGICEGTQNEKRPVRSPAQARIASFNFTGNEAATLCQARNRASSALPPPGSGDCTALVRSGAAGAL